MIEITQGGFMEENMSSLPRKYELSTLPSNEAPKKMGLKRTLLLPFLASVLFFTGMSAGCTTETERHVRQMKLPKEYGQILRDVEYYDYTTTLLDSLAALPHDLQVHETTLNYLKKIADDELITKGEIDGLKKLDHDGDGLTLDEEERLGTDPLKSNPSVKYAMDKGISYLEGVKKFDDDGMMSTNEQATIDVAAEIGKSNISDDAKKKNIDYALSDFSKFSGAYNILKSVSDKALIEMLGLGIDGNVADYISFVSQLTDKDFARYALENRLCIQDRNLAESEREFLREPNKYVQRMFDEYISTIGKTNPEQAMELIKLPDLQKIEMRDVEGLEDIIDSAQKPENKSAFESMLNEGIKDKRIYCSPLEALLWIAYDREFNDIGLIDDNNFSFKNFSIKKLIEEGWSYTRESNGPNWDRSKKIDLGADVTKLETLIWRIYNAEPYTYKLGRWKTLDEVGDRVSSPTLLIEYLNNNFKSSYSLARFPVNVKDAFKSGGACVQYATLATYCLEKNGYESYGLVIYFDKILMGADSHIICIYKDKNEKDDLYSWIDNYNPILYRIGLKRPVEHLSIDNILDKIAYQRQVGLTSATLYNIEGKSLKAITNSRRNSTVIPKNISESDLMLRLVIPYMTK